MDRGRSRGSGSMQGVGRGRLLCSAEGVSVCVCMVMMGGGDGGLHAVQRVSVGGKEVTAECLAVTQLTVEAAFELSCVHIVSCSGCQMAGG